MIELEQLADEAELAFIQASTSIQSAEDEEKMKQLLGEYLNVLKLKRLKRSGVQDSYDYVDLMADDREMWRLGK